MGRSRTNTVVLAGVVLTVLLGVVAFVARGHSAPSGVGAQNRAASQLLANAVFTIWFVAMAIGAVMLVYAIAQGRRLRRQQQTKRTSLLVRLLVVAAIPALVLALGSRLHIFNGPPQRQNPAQIASANARRKAELKREHSRKVHQPSFEWPVALGIIALLVGVTLTAFLRSKARRSRLVAEVKLDRKSVV